MFATLLLLLACAHAPPAAGASTKMPDIRDFPQQQRSSGLRVALVQRGQGSPVRSGQTVQLHYNAYLVDGQRFDSSFERQEPFVFTVGSGMVIAGFDEGVQGMLPGERRLLIIPAAIGYGANGAPPVIPPGATLVFDITYLGLAPAP
jgi:peptidylprolyl isomerase